MSYSEGDLFAENRSRGERWARAYKTMGILLNKETDLQVAAHLRAAMDDIRIAEALAYNDYLNTRACESCSTCQYAKQEAKI